MTNEEAIKVLLDEWKCIDRNDGINCDRKCESCDLVMDTFVLKDAYNTAIKALEQEPKTVQAVPIEEVLKIIEFEEKWLSQTRMSIRDIDIAFNAMKSKIKQIEGSDEEWVN